MEEGGGEQEASLANRSLESSLSEPDLRTAPARRSRCGHRRLARHRVETGGLACSRHASCFVTLIILAAVVLRSLLVCLV